MWDSKPCMVFSEEQFERTRKLALSLAGLQLSERHRELLNRRSRRLGIMDSARMEVLLREVEAGRADACQKLLGFLTTKVTGFFRYPSHFDLAAEHAVQMTRTKGEARLWSAAAATGEEPYSLTMRLIETFECDEPPIKTLATDVDTEGIRIAQRGEYGAAAVQALEPVRRERFLTETPVQGVWTMSPAVRHLVDFRVLNLAWATWPLEGEFDVIFCRNVLMYLEADHRCAVLEHIASFLDPQGLLFLDPAEHLGKAAHLFRPGLKGVYSLHECRRRSISPGANL